MRWDRQDISGKSSVFKKCTVISKGLCRVAMIEQKRLFSPLLCSIESHIIYQNVCTNILHTSSNHTSSNCEWGISDLHKKFEILFKFSKKSDLDELLFHGVT